MLKILIGDAKHRLKTLPDQSVHCCVTSPPYYNLRDYKKDDQIGLEQTPEEYIQKLVEVFREVKRVLRDDGVLFVNIGDSYARTRGTDRKVPTTAKIGNIRNTLEQTGDRTSNAKIFGLKSKDLIGIPWMLAFALRTDGWYLRQEIIWAKSNPMPESVTDRCTKSHEQIFLLTKSQRYYFDAGAIKEPVAEATRNRLSQPNLPNQIGSTRVPGKTNGNMKAVGATETRNKRSVWNVSTKPYSGAHFAVFPPDLIEPCILAGAPEYVCSKCLAPYKTAYTKTDTPDPSYKGSSFTSSKTVQRDGGDRTQPGNRFLKIPLSTTPSCKCNATPAPGVVLDPFGGSGTTAGVALKHGRKAIICELNEEYAKLIPERIEQIKSK